MKYAALFCLVFGFCVSGYADRLSRVAERILEYQLDCEKTAIVVAMDGISADEAKKVARYRAAEITISQCGRYYTIESETEVEVIQANYRQRHLLFYGNMFQELIIEKNYDRYRLQNRSKSTTCPAVRLVFTSSKTGSHKGSIDAHQLLKETGSSILK